MALGQTVPAGLYESVTFTMALCEEAKAFEDSAIADVVAIAQKGGIITFIAGEVNGQTIGYVLNAAAKGRVIQHVDDCAVGVRDKNFAVRSPDGFGAEDLLLVDVLQDEGCTVALLGFLAHGPRGHDDDIAEYLLGQVPVLGCATPADIGGIEQGRHKYPGVVEDMDAFERVERDGA